MASHVIQFANKEDYGRAITAMAEVPWTRIGWPDLKMVVVEAHVKALDSAGITYTDLTKYVPRDSPAPIPEPVPTQTQAQESNRGLVNAGSRRLGGAALLKVYFYLADGPEEPLGGEEFWLTAAPRLGETVCVLHTPVGAAGDEQSLYGKVVDLQWTVQKRNDDNNALPDWVTVDVWLESLTSQPRKRKN